MRNAISCAAVIALAVAGCTQFLPKPKAVSGSALGGPCTVSGDCAAGLNCQELVPASGASVSGEPASLCTLSCPASACPAGSACVTTTGQALADGGAGLCAPTCSSDADCRIGGRAQTCVALGDGTSICELLWCGAGGDSACPKPNCAGDDNACPSGFSCVAQPSEFGWCQAK